MEKEMKLIDENLSEEFMSIFAIGLLHCLEKKLIKPLRAEQWLFSPVLAYSLENKGKYTKAFLKSMDFASELEAASHFDCYIDSLSQSKNLFEKALRENETKQISERRSFIEGL